MNPHFSTYYRNPLVAGLVFAGLALGGTATPLAAAPTPAGIALERIVQEIRELKRLVFQLKRDEARARGERDKLRKYRDNGMRYAQGGRHVQYRNGFAALVLLCEQSPGQASLLQQYVSALEADNFVPEPKIAFAGGDVSQLSHYCRRENLSVRYGSRAQLVFSELSHDLARQADARIAHLDEKIELYKAQNIAHTDLIGKLMLCATHCHACHACYHHGYGCCGCVAPLVVEPSIAGLNSQAFDGSRTRGSQALPAIDGVATDEGRLKFLVPDEPAKVKVAAPANQIAKSKQKHPATKADDPMR